MIHRIEIRPLEGLGDPHAEEIHRHIRDLGIEAVTAVRSARLFFLAGDLSVDQVEGIAGQLLADPVIEEFRVAGSDRAGTATPSAVAIIEVHLKAGVMDPVAASAELAIREMGLSVESVRTARRYELIGEIHREHRETIARKLLANAVIEDVHFESYTPPELRARAYSLKIVETPIRDLDDSALEELSKKGDLFLNLTEMKAIQEHFRSVGR